MAGPERQQHDHHNKCYGGRETFESLAAVEGSHDTRAAKAIIRSSTHRRLGPPAASLGIGLSLQECLFVGRSRWWRRDDGDAAANRCRHVVQHAIEHFAPCRPSPNSTPRAAPDASRKPYVYVYGVEPQLLPCREAPPLARSRVGGGARAAARRALDLGRCRARPFLARSHCAAVDIRGGAGAGAFHFLPPAAAALCAAPGALGHREAARRPSGGAPSSPHLRPPPSPPPRAPKARLAPGNARALGSDAPRRKRRAAPRASARPCSTSRPPLPPRLIRTSSPRPAATQRAVRACCGARRCRWHAPPPPPTLHRCPVPPLMISAPLLPRRAMLAALAGAQTPQRRAQRHTHAPRGAAERRPARSNAGSENISDLRERKESNPPDRGAHANQSARRCGSLDGDGGPQPQRQKKSLAGVSWAHHSDWEWSTRSLARSLARAAASRGSDRGMEAAGMLGCRFARRRRDKKEL